MIVRGDDGLGLDIDAATIIYQLINSPHRFYSILRPDFSTDFYVYGSGHHPLRYVRNDLNLDDVFWRKSVSCLQAKVSGRPSGEP